MHLEKPKKILFIMQLPPPIHGASIMNNYIKNSKMINDKFDCSFINLSTSTKISEIRSFSFIKIIKFFYIFTQTIFHLLTMKTHLVFFTISPTGIGFIKDSLIVLLIKIFRKKIIFNLHGKGIKNYYKNSNFMFQKYCDYIFNDTYTIHLSKKLTDDTSHLKNFKRQFIIPNAIEEIDFDSTDKIRNDNFIQILFLSNMYKTKGVTTVLEAVKLLVDEGFEKFNVKFVGKFNNNEYKNFFENFVNENKFGKYVDYVGPLYGSDKHKIFLESDIFVFPTYNETFGIVNIEAMQYGIPIITCDEGAISDIVRNNINGFIIPKKNPGELKNKIKLLFYDKTLRKKIEVNNKKDFKKKYTLDIYEQRLLNCFNSIIEI